MFYYIKGELTYLGDSFAVADCSGVGYKIYTAVNNIVSKYALGDIVKFYTHTHIREDMFDIYGFITAEELHLFELLISVSGVGPKAALAILSTKSVDELEYAISNGNHKVISMAQGVGTKLAQRVVMELKDKVSVTQGQEREPSIILAGNNANEAVMALVALGYSLGEAKRAVSEFANLDNVEDIIKNSLKKLMK